MYIWKKNYQSKCLKLVRYTLVKKKNRTNYKNFSIVRFIPKIIIFRQSGLECEHILTVIGSVIRLVM